MLPSISNSFGRPSKTIYLPIRPSQANVTLKLPAGTLETPIVMTTPVIQPGESILAKLLSPQPMKRKSNDGSSDDQMFSCSQCPKKYKLVRGLRVHVTKKHSTAPEVPVPIIPKQSVYSDVVTMQKLPFPCPLCPKRFNNMRDVNWHLGFHRRGETAE